MPEGLYLNDQCDYIINIISKLEKNILLLREKAYDAFDYLDPHPPAKPDEAKALYSIEEMMQIIRDIQYGS